VRACTTCDIRIKDYIKVKKYIFILFYLLFNYIIYIYILISCNNINHDYCKNEPYENKYNAIIIMIMNDNNNNNNIN